MLSRKNSLGTNLKDKKQHKIFLLIKYDLINSNDIMYK